MDIQRCENLVMVTYNGTPLDKVPKMDGVIRSVAAEFGGRIVDESGNRVKDAIAPTYEPATKEWQSQRKVPLWFPSEAKAKECEAKFENMRKYTYGAMIKCGDTWQQATIACKHVLLEGAPIGKTEARDESDPNNVEHAYIWCQHCTKEHLVTVCSDCIVRRFATHEVTAA
jgi:hypothetical protein